ncbi:MAG: hypothetical protein GY820_15380 [Gammaproteobacteria bacterium]|nr:hypothetical protein [Gammaproteobacteria bacterium]
MFHSGARLLKDTPFIKERNAQDLWHPMAYPLEMKSNPPKIIASAEGVCGSTAKNTLLLYIVITIYRSGWREYT